MPRISRVKALRLFRLCVPRETIWRAGQGLAALFPQRTGRPYVPRGTSI